MLEIALKEWAATCLALERGEQVILLRKGGLRDEEGIFRLESSRFWLLPTYLHQDLRLVKPEFQPLLQQAGPQDGEGDRFFLISLWAEVARTWTLQPDRSHLLQQVAHIWSEAYLELRRSFRPEEPIVCAALRVHRLPAPHHVKVLPQYLGCRSWVDVPSLSTADSRPCLSEAAFSRSISEIEAVLGQGNL